MSARMSQSRLGWLDQLRGLAIVLMILFHASYNLAHFDFVEINFNSLFWQAFRNLILGLFFFTSGWALSLGRHRPIHWPAFLRRFFQVAGSALLVSLITWLLFPDRWIYFGILHFFAVSMWLALPFRRHPQWALLAALSILIIDAHYGTRLFAGLFDLVQPVLALPDGTLDIARLTPGFAAVLLGLYLGQSGFSVPDRMPLTGLPRLPFSSQLSWAGRHPLTLYLIHQPVLYGSTAALWWTLT